MKNREARRALRLAGFPSVSRDGQIEQRRRTKGMSAGTEALQFPAGTLVMVCRSRQEQLIRRFSYRES